jgi:hypothetical protein
MPVKVGWFFLVLYNFFLHTKQPIALSPPEWNKAFPHIEGSVALAGVPASMHFFINLIDRTEWTTALRMTYEVNLKK